MSVLLFLLLLGVVGWAVSFSRRSRPEADRGWKNGHVAAKTPARRAVPNRSPWNGQVRVRLLPAPFRPGDLVRVDGEWYHLPTLLRLHHAGRLSWGSPGWRALEQAERGRRLN